MRGVHRVPDPFVDSVGHEPLLGFGLIFLFGLGLAVSQMVNPGKVLAFLDIAGDWDPSLALVLVAAAGITMIGYRIALARAKPLFADVFQVPTRTAIDGRLIAGAVIFGTGWGLAGMCPGPAITAIAFLQEESLYFLPALALGLFIARRAA